MHGQAELRLWWLRMTTERSLLNTMGTIANYIKIAWDYMQPSMIYPAIVLAYLFFFYRYYIKVSRPCPGTT